MRLDSDITLCAGGGVKALTTTESVMDVRALAGCKVAIWSDDQDVWFCGTSAAAGGTLVTAGTDSAASVTALIADRVGKGSKVFRTISAAEGYIVAKTVTGSGALKIKVVQRPGGGV